MRYAYQYRGQTFTLDLDRLPDGRFKAIIADREYVFAASQLANNGWLINIQNGQQVAYTAAHQDKRHVHINGQPYTFQRDDGRNQTRQRTGLAGGTLTAEMPGQVMDVRVSEGETVTSGQVLVILEAMKMEIRITAPADSLVKQIPVQTGDVVERGQTLIDLDVTDAAASG